ncbi:BTB/POZ protein [Rhizophagus irregularis DAOM 181602=DAOM 197198]|nr:BTB/POZ protein [Rhizophagus irregularis DAOM 181602=DAOM 197198]
MSSLKFTSNLSSLLSQSLLNTLDNDEYYDITIEVGNDTDESEDENLAHIKLPNILPEIFEIVLRYIYGGKLDLEINDTSNIIKVLVAVSELGLQELVPLLQSFLINKNVKWMEQNFNLVFETCFENDSFPELQKYCVKFLSKNPDNAFKLLNLSSISEKSLISLIQHENLKMSVVQIWNHIIKWGLSHNSELPSDITKFSKDDFYVLKDTLKDCIPFVKFFYLSSKEFLDNVLPFRDVLPEELHIENYILSRVQNEKQAVTYYSRYGPSFGNGDLIIFGGTEHTFDNYVNYCKKSSYKKQIRQSIDKFSIEDCEVFQIKRFSFNNKIHEIISDDIDDTDTDIIHSTMFSEEIIDEFAE